MHDRREGRPERRRVDPGAGQRLGLDKVSQLACNPEAGDFDAVGHQCISKVMSGVLGPPAFYMPEEAGQFVVSRFA
jgi:hypothetical protein